MNINKECSNSMKILCRFLNKYAQVDRRAYDFEVGGPLYPREIHTLVFLKDQGGSYVTEMAAQTGVTKGAVSQIVKKLEAKGLLTREPDKDNLSRMILKVTDKGAAACDRHDCMHRERDVLFFEYLKGLEAGKIQFMHELFREMDKWMDNYLD